MKNNRILSFIFVSIVYVLASILGIVLFNHLNYSFWVNLLISDVAATIFVFIFSLVFKNASVYDPYWSVQPIVILLALSFKYQLTGASVLVVAAVLLWGIRLTANWAYTFKNLLHEDWRYKMLNEKTGRFYPVINFIGIHLVPTLVVYGCVLPACYLIISKSEINLFTVVFFVLAILCVLLQGVSDIDMHKYRKEKKTPFNRNGLWKYSRHPNYLAEILIWWMIGLLCVLTMNNMHYLLIGPFINSCLFFFVSIPMAEARQSKKEGYMEYKRETRILLPIKK